MLNQSELLAKIADASSGALSIDDFEAWFRPSSRNVHIWGGEDLEDLVYAIEGVFSEHHFADLDDEGTRAALNALLVNHVASEETRVEVSFTPIDKLTTSHRKAMGIASGVVQVAKFGEAHQWQGTASQLVAAAHPLA